MVFLIDNTVQIEILQDEVRFMRQPFLSVQREGRVVSAYKIHFVVLVFFSCRRIIRNNFAVVFGRCFQFCAIAEFVLDNNIIREVIDICGAFNVGRGLVRIQRKGKTTGHEVRRYFSDFFVKLHFTQLFLSSKTVQCRQGCFRCG